MTDGPVSPAGERMESDTAGKSRIGGGRIADLWVIGDNLSALAQISLSLHPHRLTKVRLTLASGGHHGRPNFDAF